MLQYTPVYEYIGMMDLYYRYIGRRPHLAQFVRYVFAGGITASIELMLFLLFVRSGVWHVYANSIAFGVAVIFGFFAQKYFTFKNNELKHASQAAKFALVIGVGFVLTQLLTTLFIDVFHWIPFIAKCAQLILVMCWNYTGQKWFTFKIAKS